MRGRAIGLLLVVAAVAGNFSDDIRMAWWYEHRLPEWRRERLRQAVIGCVRDAGVAVR